MKKKKRKGKAKRENIKTLNEIFGAETSKVSKNSQMTKRELSAGSVWGYSV